jgi:hypothetical protein
MKRSAFAFAILVCCVVASASDPPKCPGVFGIACVRILVTNVDEARDFYALALDSIPRSNDTAPEEKTVIGFAKTLSPCQNSTVYK